MIRSDTELQVTLERIRRIQEQLGELRRQEANPVNYRLSSGGFIAELDRMQLEVREYLTTPPQLATAR